MFTESSFPDTLILDCSKEISQFRQVLVDGLDMPSLIDFDATLSIVFDAISKLATLDTAVFGVRDRIVDNESLFESEYDENENGQQERLLSAVRSFANQIKNKLLWLQAYSCGHFHYKFRTLQNDGTIIVSKIPRFATGIPFGRL